MLGSVANGHPPFDGGAVPMSEEIDPERVKEKIDAGEDVQIVDIRSADEYERGHLPGAINIPFVHLPREIDRHSWGDDVVVVCPVGESSIQAARLIESYEGVPEDAHVASMRGGYADWSYELEAGDGDGDDESAGGTANAEEQPF